jgi:hypothetical protein
LAGGHYGGRAGQVEKSGRAAEHAQEEGVQRSASTPQGLPSIGSLLN